MKRKERQKKKSAKEWKARLGATAIMMVYSRKEVSCPGPIWPWVGLGLG